MSTLQDKAAAISSISLRLAAYTFLRWIPGSPFPNIIYTLFAIYIPSFIASFITQQKYNVLEDEIDITVTESEVDDQPPTAPSTAAHSKNLPPTEKPTHVEEVDIQETLVLQERSPKILRTLLTGLPSPTSALLSLITLLINIALVAGVTDYIYRAKTFHSSEDLSFARIGYVSPTEARLLIREPDQSKLPIFVSIRIHEPVAPFDQPGWKSAGGINYLSNETDFTAVVPIQLNGWAPEKSFQWVTSTNHTGYFTVPPKPGAQSIRNDGQFTFLTSSCIKPRFPYNPVDHPLSIPGFKHLAKNLPALGAQFMLFLGDFIYIDVPKRFGTATEDYRREYRQVYASPDWPSVSQNLSWIHVLDDHEISNDWDKNTTGVYRAAADPYDHYQVAVNPPPARKAGSTSEVRSGATYFEFTQGPAAFFMMDTRTYRNSSSDLPVDSQEKTMLGNKQLDDLLAFLARPAPAGVKWKIVASSIPFTKNWRVNNLDTWAGYLAERKIILEAMWDVGLRGGVGVVVLSGDRHEFAATAFPPPTGGKWPISATVNEFSTSPLSQFYLPIRTYSETDEEDVMVKYVPDGNSKFGAISIENPPASDQSILKFRLFVDGEEYWESVLLSPPTLPSGRLNKIKDAIWG